MNRSIRILLVSALIMLAGIACRMGGITLNRDSASVNVQLSEEQVKALVTGADNLTENMETAFLDHIDDVELHDGFIRLFGTAEINQQPVSGSMDISLAAEDGMLLAKIISVDIPDMDINDPSVQYANQMIEEQLSRQFSQSQGNVSFEEAQVTEDALNLRIRLKLNNNDQ